MLSSAVLLDAGGTLIVENPGDERPMVAWPHLQAVAGAAEALRAIKARQPDCRLLLASNADVSTGEMARQALARLGMDGFFSAFHTSVDLGLRKPDPAFFHAILAAAGAAPSGAVMVGNSFPIDILGAKAAGLAAIWYNPELTAAPGGVPLQDAEIAAMEQLPQVLQNPLLPDLPTCLGWLQGQGADSPLVGHVSAVAFAAYHIACALRVAGCAIDPILAHRGAVLHDLDKKTHAGRGLPHGEYSARLLEARGWPSLAGIARRHLFSSRNLDASLTLEEKVVLYADKLVEGDQFAGLDHRVEMLMQRYPAYAGGMRACLPQLQALEQELCALASLQVSQLYAELRAGWPDVAPHAQEN